MITFINKLSYPVILNFDDDYVEIAEYEKYILNNKDNSIEFSISNEENKKFSISAFLLLMFIGVITLLLDMADNHFVHFEKYVSIPIKVKLPNVQSDVTVEIDSNPNHLASFFVYADTEKEVTPIIDELDVKKQYKEYKRETFAVMFLPIILVLGTIYIFIFNQAYVIAAIIFACAFGVWLYFHKMNKKTINEILSK